MGQGALSRLLGMVFAVALALPIPGAGLAADITGMKALGGSVGTSLMIGDSEYRAHARPRFTGDAVFKYGFRPKWALVGSFGYGWNSYSAEERWLTEPEFAAVRSGQGLDAEGPVEKVVAVSPFTVGVELRFGTESWVPYVGGGGGVYLLQLLHDRQVALDPRTFADHRTFDFGVHGRAGTERFVSESTSIDLEAIVHFILSSDRTLFPEASAEDLMRFGGDFLTHGGNAQLVQVRVGLRYYWGQTD